MSSEEATMIRDVRSTALSLPTPRVPRLPAPGYAGDGSNGIAMAVESMKRHTADAGWQIMRALEINGYRLCGHRLPPVDTTDTEKILAETNPGVVMVQDKREWDVGPRNFRERRARFHNVQSLAEREDVFKLTILKDAHQRPEYHRESAREMGVHAWVVYYHPKIVTRVAPYLRPEHLIRTYHTVDPSAVPEFNRDRSGTLFSGAVSTAYPLRKRIVQSLDELGVGRKRHPGYGMRGCVTPDFLKLLSRYRVAICTSSRYGYSLRKHVEATACGCVVVTDLPVDDVLPEIDGNLVRIDPDIKMDELADLLRVLETQYDSERQRFFAGRAVDYYSYESSGRRLVEDIERMRNSYDEE